MGFLDGKRNEPVAVKNYDIADEAEPFTVAVEPAVEPAVDPVKPVINYKILNTLLERKFISVQSGMVINDDGVLVEKYVFILTNQPGRGNISRTIPVLYCPVTGVSLADVDASQLTIK